MAHSNKRILRSQKEEWELVVYWHGIIFKILASWKKSRCKRMFSLGHDLCEKGRRKHVDMWIRLNHVKLPLLGCFWPAKMATNSVWFHLMFAWKYIKSLEICTVITLVVFEGGRAELTRRQGGDFAHWILSHGDITTT